MRRPWNPTGLLAAGLGGLAFGATMAVIISLIYGSWWYMVLALPMAVAWCFLWPSAYQRAYRRTAQRRRDGSN
jgi:hypothetical protein